MIIPDGTEEVRISSLKLSQVTVQDGLLGVNSVGQGGRGGPGLRTEWQYGFLTPSGPGVRSAQAVWTFFANPIYIPNRPVSILKVFSLARYLGKPEQGLHSVDDIITAVEAGWKMQEIGAQPKLTYHPETKLLMAFGQEAHLTLIADVLKQLEPPVPAPVYKGMLNPEVQKALEKGGQVMPQEPTKSK